jgi:hypothetical protein
MATGSVVALLALSGSASAQSCQAPPGTSGIDQYCEAIPGPGHNQGRGDRGGAANETTGRPVPRSARRSLQTAGKDGAALLQLTGKSPAQKGTTNTGRSNGSRSASKESGSDPFSAVKSAAQSGTSAGPGFVWGLVVIAVFMGGMGWMAYRRRRAPTGP